MNKIGDFPPIQRDTHIVCIKFRGDKYPMNFKKRRHIEVVKKEKKDGIYCTVLIVFVAV